MGRQEPVAWINEDELPESYPYDAMFPYSKVDFVRMFPVYAPSTQVVPDGWKLVPVTPTAEMLDAAWHEGCLTEWQIREHWLRMLEAAPEAPQAPQRVPLSEWRIVKLYEKWTNTPGASHADLIRLAERAHGITGTQGGGNG